MFKTMNGNTVNVCICFFFPDSYNIMNINNFFTLKNIKRIFTKQNLFLYFYWILTYTDSSLSEPRHFTSQKPFNDFSFTI